MKKVKIVCPLLNDINNDEIPVIEERKSRVTLNNLHTQTLFENKQEKVQKIDTTSNLISDIFDPIDSTIDENVGVVSDRKHERTNSKSIGNNLNIGFNKKPLDAYRFKNAYFKENRQKLSKCHNPLDLIRVDMTPSWDHF